MSDLSTTYMGLKLNNPLIVASCSLSKTEEGIHKCADAGAGAIVLKSLFEEQIEFHAKADQENLWMSSHTEAFDYLNKMGMEIGPQDYLKLIEKAKKSVKIPIIASLNCISAKWWLEYAKQIVLAGADGLELNIAVLPGDPNHTSQQIEKIYLDILDAVSAAIKIPIAVKIGPHFSSIPYMAEQLAKHGAKALVLFNRFYQLDIDIEKMELAPGYRFSSQEELSLSLRWMSMLAGKVPCDLAASTGIHTGAGVIKQILAGATAIQICSALYLNQIPHLQKIRTEVETWMDQHKIQSLQEIRGKLSQKMSHKPEIYERLQYIEALIGID